MQQYLGLPPGAGYGHRLEHKADSLIAKFKEAGGKRSERLMYEQSHRDYLRSGYLHHRLPVMRLINHYRDNAITYKAQRDKNARELKLANAQLLTCRCVSVMLLRSMQKQLKELADAKAENDALRDDVAAIAVGCTSKQSVSQCVKPLSALAWIMQPRLADTAERDYFTLRERLITMQKQIVKPRSISS